MFFVMNVSLSLSSLPLILSRAQVVHALLSSLSNYMLACCITFYVFAVLALFSSSWLSSDNDYFSKSNKIFFVSS